MCTTGLETIEPSASVDDALRKMREADIRRLPVVQDGRPIGIVSLGDLAVKREPALDARRHLGRLAGQLGLN